jgi:N-ethylmaleimide reductase
MALFNPLRIGALNLKNRILMAPLTRSRAAPGHVPTELMATYYSQRASAGLIVAEATMVSEGNSAFWAEPGVYNDVQVAAWRQVTDAVHAKGGQILLQLWHGGRACHPLMNGGATPVAPSSIPITSDGVYTPNGKVPYATPRELRDDEVPHVVADFKRAAQNAKAAGFDGVELHGANGYVLDQFLRDSANKRSPPYGGTVENRVKLLLDVVDAAVGVWGGGRVGVRLSTVNSYNSMSDADPLGLTAFVASRLGERGVAFLHVMRGDFLQIQKGDPLPVARKAFNGAIIANMGYSFEEATAAVEGGGVDAVAFGVPFLANPDLPERFLRGAPLNAPRPDKFYVGGAEGYTDYPTLAQTQA